jgi:amidase
VYALDAIYGIDERDNYTAAQAGKTPQGGYIQYMSNKDALKDATFGIPWDSFWTKADADQLDKLLSLIDLIKSAGATVVNNTELPNYQTIVSPTFWNWDYGTTRGYPNESEYTVVKVDFYNNIKAYLSELENTPIRSLEDIVAYNYANDGSEGGNPWPGGIPAFYSGQDGLLASLESKGVTDETYFQALSFCQRSTREEGIDAALSHNGQRLDALLVPPDVGQTYQISAQAGYPLLTIPASTHIETGMPYGLALMVSAWEEDRLVKWGSAIEDLIFSMGNGQFGRTSPRWYEYLTRNIPVLNL